MTVELHAVNNALVLRDNIYTWRWYDAFGSGVVKYLQEFATLPSDDTTGDATEWELTITEAGAGDTTHVVTDRAGGALLITSAGNENDGINMQLGAVAGESVKLDGNYPLYCGIKFAINDVDQTDIFFGVGVTNTDWSGGLTDGLYFRSEDASAVVYLVAEKNSVESVVTAATLADDTYIILEFLFDGSTVYAYADGALQGSIANSSTSFPNDEELRLTLEFLTGEATANTCTVEWLRMIHIR